MNNTSIIKSLTVFLLSFFCWMPQVYSQDCDYEYGVAGPGTTTRPDGSVSIITGQEEIGNGQVGCIKGDFFGTVTVRPGGMVRICGTYETAGSIFVDNGGVIVVSAGTKVGFTGSVTINHPGTPGFSAVQYEGDATCGGELYNATAGFNCSVTSSANVACNTWGVSDDPRVHLVGFYWNWGEACTKGAAKTTSVSGTCSNPWDCTGDEVCTAPVLNGLSNVTACDSYTLPTITGSDLSGSQAYYTGPGGTGTQYSIGAIITSSTTLYIYDSNGDGCTDEESFTVTITAAPDAGTSSNASLCSSDAVLDLNDQLSGQDGGGVWSPSSIFDPSSDTPGSFIYTVSGSGACTGENDISTVVVSVTAAPDAGTSSNASLCSIDATLSLDGQLTGQDGGGVWSPKSTFDPSSDTPGSFTYTVSGSGACTGENDISTVVVSVTAAPEAGTSSNASLCSSDVTLSLDDQLTGQDGGGVWSPKSTFDPSSDTPGSFTYTVSGSGACSGENDISIVVVSVTAAPEAGTSSNASLCSSDVTLSLDDQLTGQDGSGVWSPSSTFDPGSDTPGSFTYTVSGSGACTGENDISTVVVSVTSAPEAGKSSNADLCSSDATLSLDDQLTGQDVGGVWSPSSTFDPSSDTPGSFTYTVSGTGACIGENDISTVVVSVTTAPDAGSDVTTEYCAEDVVVDVNTLLSGADAGGTWNMTPSFDPSTDVNLTFVYTVTGTGVCTGTDDIATITITSLELTGAGDDISRQYCISEPVVNVETLLSNATVGGTWNVTPSYDPSSGASVDYIYSRQGSGACSAFTDQATISLSSSASPSAGNDVSNEYCTTDAVVDVNTLLSSAQPGGVWDKTPSFDPSNGRNDSFTYTVSGSGACSGSSDQATISLSVTVSPNAGSDVLNSYCSSDAVVDVNTLLSGADATGTWNITPSYDPSLGNDVDYIYTVSGTGACSGSDDVSLISLAVVTQPDAGTASNADLCSSDAVIDLNNQLVGQDAGGVWAPSSNFDPANDTPGSFTYTVVGTGVCLGTDAVSTVVVSVTSSPEAGVAANADLCSSDAVINLNDKLTGQDAGGVWSPSSTFDPSNDTPGEYKYAVLGSGVCTGSNDTATVVITVTTAPNSGTSANADLCSSDAILDLNNQLSGQDVGGTWSPSSSFNPSGDASGDYTYTVLGTAACIGTDAISTVTIAVTAAPNAGTASDADICSEYAILDLEGQLAGQDLNGVWIPSSEFDPSSDAPGEFQYIVLGTGACTGNNDTSRINVAVTDAPNAGTANDIAFCSNEAVISLDAQLSSQDAGGTWSPSPTFDPSTDTPGVFEYVVLGTGVCTGTNDTARVTVAVTVAPNAGTSSATELCSNEAQLNLVDQISGQDVGGIWIPAETFDPTLDTPGDFKYVVLGSAECTGVNDTATISVSVLDAPNAGNDMRSEFCSDDPVVDVSTLLTGADAGGTWLSATSFDPTNLTDEIFEYVVSGTGACAGQSDTSQVSITVLTDFSQVSLSSSMLSACEGQNVRVNVIDSLGGGNSPVFEWYLNSVLVTPGVVTSNYEFSSTNEADTIVVKMISSSQCGNPEVYDTIYVAKGLVIDPSLTIDLSADSYCSDETIFASIADSSNVGGGLEVTWYTENDTLGNAGEFSAADLIGADSIWAVVTSDLPCLSTTEVVSQGIPLTIYQTPLAEAGPNIVSAEYVDVTISSTEYQVENVSGAGVTYQWTSQYNSNELNITSPTSLDEEIQVSPTESSTYYYLTVTENGCKTTDSLLLEIEVDVWIPDVFSPNGDGFYDVMNIENAQWFDNLKLEVYNRWGSLLYETNDPLNQPWDGTYKGDELPIASYYYILYINDGDRMIEGVISIIR